MTISGTKYFVIASYAKDWSGNYPFYESRGVSLGASWNLRVIDIYTVCISNCNDWWATYGSYMIGCSEKLTTPYQIQFHQMNLGTNLKRSSEAKYETATNDY